MQSEEGQSKREIPIRARCPVYERGQRQDSGVGMKVETGKSVPTDAVSRFYRSNTAFSTKNEIKKNFGKIW